ncbi:hypothetical protein BESB_020890 [Besnoitia besnoiti]|uniref:non-specific serine/threonine protein kinase n=1 Tax=Besnoitia besnoiti TaxID=94643 RepID=A0A2A9M0M7_BESBE|nr:hypothetical protein BESB_020890 [Besnoitia besnoiti]PFH32148.1 hypothetical protein BESB_020890 [Besnoitia besnoiti]
MQPALPFCRVGRPTTTARACPFPDSRHDAALLRRLSARPGSAPPDGRRPSAPKAGTLPLPRPTGGATDAAAPPVHASQAAVFPPTFGFASPTATVPVVSLPHITVNVCSHGLPASITRTNPSTISLGVGGDTDALATATASGRPLSAPLVSVSIVGMTPTPTAADALVLSHPPAPTIRRTQGGNEALPSSNHIRHTETYPQVQRPPTQLTPLPSSHAGSSGFSVGPFALPPAVPSAWTEDGVRTAQLASYGSCLRTPPGFHTTSTTAASSFDRSSVWTGACQQPRVVCSDCSSSPEVGTPERLALRRVASLPAEGFARYRTGNYAEQQAHCPGDFPTFSDPDGFLAAPGDPNESYRSPVWQVAADDAPAPPATGGPVPPFQPNKLQPESGIRGHLPGYKSAKESAACYATPWERPAKHEGRPPAPHMPEPSAAAPSGGTSVPIRLGDASAPPVYHRLALPTDAHDFHSEEETYPPCVLTELTQRLAPLSVPRAPPADAPGGSPLGNHPLLQIRCQENQESRHAKSTGPVPLCERRSQSVPRYTPEHSQPTISPGGIALRRKNSCPCFASYMPEGYRGAPPGEQGVTNADMHYGNIRTLQAAPSVWPAAAVPSGARQGPRPPQTSVPFSRVDHGLPQAPSPSRRVAHSLHGDDSYPPVGGYAARQAPEAAALGDCIWSPPVNCRQAAVALGSASERPNVVPSSRSRSASAELRHEFAGAGLAEHGATTVTMPTGPMRVSSQMSLLPLSHQPCSYGQELDFPNPLPRNVESNALACYRTAHYHQIPRLSQTQPDMYHLTSPRAPDTHTYIESDGFDSGERRNGGHQFHGCGSAAIRSFSEPARSHAYSRTRSWKAATDSTLMASPVCLENRESAHATRYLPGRSTGTPPASLEPLHHPHESMAQRVPGPVLSPRCSAFASHVAAQRSMPGHTADAASASLLPAPSLQGAGGESEDGLLAPAKRVGELTPHNPPHAQLLERGNEAACSPRDGGGVIPLSLTNFAEPGAAWATAVRQQHAANAATARACGSCSETVCQPRCLPTASSPAQRPAWSPVAHQPQPPSVPHMLGCNTRMPLHARSTAGTPVAERPSTPISFGLDRSPPPAERGCMTPSRSQGLRHPLAGASKQTTGGSTASSLLTVGAASESVACASGSSCATFPGDSQSRLLAESAQNRLTVQTQDSLVNCQNTSGHRASGIEMYAHFPLSPSVGTVTGSSLQLTGEPHTLKRSLVTSDCVQGPASGLRISAPGTARESFESRQPAATGIAACKSGGLRRNAPPGWTTQDGESSLPTLKGCGDLVSSAPSSGCSLDSAAVTPCSLALETSSRGRTLSGQAGQAAWGEQSGLLTTWEETHGHSPCRSSQVEQSGSGARFPPASPREGALDVTRVSTSRPGSDAWRGSSGLTAQASSWGSLAAQSFSTGSLASRAAAATSADGAVPLVGAAPQWSQSLLGSTLSNAPEHRTRSTLEAQQYLPATQNSEIARVVPLDGSASQLCHLTQMGSQTPASCRASGVSPRAAGASTESECGVGLRQELRLCSSRCRSPRDMLSQSSELLSHAVSPAVGLGDLALSSCASPLARRNVIVGDGGNTPCSGSGRLVCGDGGTASPEFVDGTAEVLHTPPMHPQTPTSCRGSTSRSVATSRIAEPHSPHGTPPVSPRPENLREHSPSSLPAPGGDETHSTLHQYPFQAGSQAIASGETPPSMSPRHARCSSTYAGTSASSLSPAAPVRSPSSVTSCHSVAHPLTEAAPSDTGRSRASVSECRSLRLGEALDTTTDIGSLTTSRSCLDIEQLFQTPVSQQDMRSPLRLSCLDTQLSSRTSPSAYESAAFGSPTDLSPANSNRSRTIIPLALPAAEPASVRSQSSYGGESSRRPRASSPTFFSKRSSSPASSPGSSFAATARAAASSSPFARSGASNVGTPVTATGSTSLQVSQAASVGAWTPLRANLFSPGSAFQSTPVPYSPIDAISPFNGSHAVQVRSPLGRNRRVPGLRPQSPSSAARESPRGGRKAALPRRDRASGKRSPLFCVPSPSPSSADGVRSSAFQSRMRPAGRFLEQGSPFFPSTASSPNVGDSPLCPRRGEAAPGVQESDAVEVGSSLTLSADRQTEGEISRPRTSPTSTAEAVGAAAAKAAQAQSADAISAAARANMPAAVAASPSVLQVLGDTSPAVSPLVSPIGLAGCLRPGLEATPRSHLGRSTPPANGSPPSDSPSPPLRFPQPHVSSLQTAPAAAAQLENVDASAALQSVSELGPDLPPPARALSALAPPRSAAAAKNRSPLELPSEGASVHSPRATASGHTVQEAYSILPSLSPVAAAAASALPPEASALVLGHFFPSHMTPIGRGDPPASRASPPLTPRAAAAAAAARARAEAAAATAEAAAHRAAAVAKSSVSPRAADASRRAADAATAAVAAARRCASASPRIAAAAQRTAAAIAAAAAISAAAAANAKDVAEARRRAVPVAAAAAAVAAARQRAAAASSKGLAWTTPRGVASLPSNQSAVAWRPQATPDSSHPPPREADTAARFSWTPFPTSAAAAAAAAGAAAARAARGLAFASAALGRPGHPLGSAAASTPRAHRAGEVSSAAVSHDFESAQAETNARERSPSVAAIPRSQSGAAGSPQARGRHRHTVTPFLCDGEQLREGAQGEEGRGRGIGGLRVMPSDAEVGTSRPASSASGLGGLRGTRAPGENGGDAEDDVTESGARSGSYYGRLNHCDPVSGRAVFIKKIPAAVWEQQWRLAQRYKGFFLTDGENFVGEAALSAFLTDCAPLCVAPLLAILHEAGSLPESGPTSSVEAEGLDTTSTGGRFVLVNQGFGQGDLLDFFDNADPEVFTPASKRSLQYSVTQILVALHSAGVAHLDLTPENVLVHAYTEALPSSVTPHSGFGAGNRIGSASSVTPSAKLSGGSAHRVQLKVCDLAKAAPLFNSSPFRLPQCILKAHFSDTRLDDTVATDAAQPFLSCEPTVAKGPYMPPECWRIVYILRALGITAPFAQVGAPLLTTGRPPPPLYLKDPPGLEKDLGAGGIGLHVDVSAGVDAAELFFDVRKADVYMLGALMFWIWAEGSIWTCSDPRQDTQYNDLLQGGLEFGIFTDCDGWPTELLHLLKGALEPNPARRSTLAEILRHPWWTCTLAAT